MALCWFLDFREFIEVELDQAEPREARKVIVRAYPLGVPKCLDVSSLHVWSPPEASKVSLVQKKIVKKFFGIWTSFGTNFLEKTESGKK